MNWLAKLLFPKHDRSLQRKELRMLGITLLLAVLASGIIGVLIYIINLQKRI
jgi:hypothetical protein